MRNRWRMFRRARRHDASEWDNECVFVEDGKAFNREDEGGRGQPLKGQWRRCGFRHR
jgi:hypothetical protein